MSNPLKKTLAALLAVAVGVVLLELGSLLLFERLTGARVIYLAEKHDNARHHELQLEVLRELVERGIREISRGDLRKLTHETLVGQGKRKTNRR